MISRALADEELPVYGKGENVRDWLHVSDHCEAIDLIIHKGKVGEVYNVGGHNERTNLEVVKTILKALDKPESLIKFVTDRPGHDMRYAIDPTKLETELGWEPKYNFDTGIAQTIEWYLNNKEWWIRCTETAYRSLYESTETDKTSVILGDNTRFDDFDFFIFCKERHILSRDEYRICERTCKDPKLSWIFPDSF